MKWGITSSPYGSYDQGYYMCYNEYYNDLQVSDDKLIYKDILSTYWRLKESSWRKIH